LAALEGHRLTLNGCVVMTRGDVAAGAVGGTSMELQNQRLAKKVIRSLVATSPDIPEGRASKGTASPAHVLILLIVEIGFGVGFGVGV